jgi:hypothetical protein
LDNEHELVKKFISLINDQISSKQNFYYKIGWEITKSGKPYLFIWKNEHFQVVEVDMETAKEFKFEPYTIIGSYYEEPNSIYGDDSKNQKIIISKINLENSINGDQKITGDIVYETKAPINNMIAVAMRYKYGFVERTEYFYPTKWLNNDGIIHFEFPPINNEKAKLWGSYEFTFMIVEAPNTSPDKIISNKIKKRFNIL